MRIRPYEEKDRDCVKVVSVRTGGNPTAEKDKRALWCLFLDYYIEIEPDCCFVAADDDDNAVGFVIAASDHIEYEKIYREKYLAKLSRIKWHYGVYKRFELLLSRKFGKKYKAHLHIDINPEYQRAGLGHRLMNALI
ncbi:MAG: GNAT family N-acetyltransferase, partial [Clostridia bacterium]|nr:GNAT family N-acetyltransferase [Clostridia bacterium]